MACVRPAWTCCFACVWMLVVPGAFLTHLALLRLQPHLKDLPNNIVKGFDETFKFAHLEQDSKSVERTAAAALQKCAIVANVSCPNSTYHALVAQPGETSNTTNEQTLILGFFANSLGIVNKIANDKYFGVQGLSSTGQALNKIVQDMNQLNGTMKCVKSTPIYCNIYTSANNIVAGMSSVTGAIDAFKTSDIIERWDDNQRFIVLLHALPYIMVVALLFFTCFWMKGGVCCFCRGGTIAGTLALIPYALFWLLSFVIYIVVCSMGVVLKYGADRIPVPVLNGRPTLEQAIEHFQTEYPEFWKLVFADMVDGLDLLFKASLFFVGASLIIALYSCCECCYCPYRKPSKEGNLKAAS